MNHQIRALFIIGVIAMLVMAGALATTGTVKKSTATERWNVFSISTKSTKGTIKWLDKDGKRISSPIAGDGKQNDGSSTTEAVFFATTANPEPNEYLYLEGEQCHGSSKIDDCAEALFLVISSKKAHVLKISEINTETHEISFRDTTAGKDGKNNFYTDGAQNSFTVGDLQFTLFLNEATTTIEFTSIGSNNGAKMQLYDGATLEIVNTDLSSQEFEGLKFKEYNDGALAAEKYIGQGGNDPLLIRIFYDDMNDRSMEISDSLITDLTKDLGSGWYTSSGDKSFYSNKGTLFIYDEDQKHKLTIGHIGYTKGKKQL